MFGLFILLSNKETSAFYINKGTQLNIFIWISHGGNFTIGSNYVVNKSDALLYSTYILSVV